MLLFLRCGFVKYGSYLPTFLRKLTRVRAPQLSLSKYALCREKLR